MFSHVFHGFFPRIQLNEASPYLSNMHKDASVLVCLLEIEEDFIKFVTIRITDRV